MARKPIETVQDARIRAKRRLSRPVYQAILGGNERGTTLRRNVDAFDEIGVVPRVGTPVELEQDFSTAFMGMDMTMPLMMSPAGAQVLHVEGEVPVARATKKAGLAMGHSNFASSPFEDVVAENPSAVFQLYWSGSRDEIQRRVERMRRLARKRSS